MQMSMIMNSATLVLLIFGCAGFRSSQDMMPTMDPDPFGSLLPPMQGNPALLIPVQQAGGTGIQAQHAEQVAQAKERILSSEDVLTEQVELREEEKMEVECVGMEHLREVTTYENEQQEAEQEIKSIRSFKPTEAEHKCLPLHMRNKKIPGRLLKDLPRNANVPAFPERIGEIVIEAVHHVDTTQKAQHVVLELVACTACENDYEDFVEWGGLLATDETGSYRKMYKYGNTDNFGKGHWFLGKRKPIVAAPSTKQAGYPRVFDFAQTPARKQLYVKQYKYKYSSFKFDETIEPKVKQMAEEAVSANAIVNPEFVHAHEQEELSLMKELLQQERHIPFNHKLEQLHMNVYVCQEEGGALKCPQDPAETLIVHDGALAFDSARTAVLDQLGREAAGCAYGPCQSSRGVQGVGRGDFTPFTMCSGCTSSSRCGHHSRTQPSPALATLVEGTQTNRFNCLVERAYTPSGYVDLLLQSEASRDPKARPGAGLLYRGSASPGHVTGHVNWHLTLPRSGECEPFLQDATYLGIGVDECDKCPDGAVDVDIGVILLSCSRDPKKDTLRIDGNCAYYHHLNYAQRKAKNDYYAISEDERSGEGEGDDEWLFLNLAGLRGEGVTHALVVANIYACKGGRTPEGGIGWQDLEGAFLRITGSGLSSKDFESAPTVSYVDLDAMQGPAKNGAGLVMFYLSEDAKLAKAPEMLRTDEAAGSGLAWKMLVAKKPLNGATLSRVAQEALTSFGLTYSSRESTIAEQAEDMEVTTAMSTGQAIPGVTDELGPVVNDGIQQAESMHLAGETVEAKRAKSMGERTFWGSFAATMPEGPPGTDALCAPFLQKARNL